MSGQAVQVQWSLDPGVNFAVNTIGGLLRAAASDNVQPIAVIACEKLGASLPACLERMASVRSDFVATPMPTQLKFLKATVGFSANDCATQLATSDAGVRFLVLAAALITSMPLFSGAQVLRSMMLKNGFSPVETPSVSHLRDLLTSLETKSHKLKFAESISWYAIRVAETTNSTNVYVPRYGKSSLARQIQENSIDRSPAIETIVSLVDVLCQVARIGESDVTGVTVRVGESAPWVLAFAQWILGNPPSIFLKTDGKPLFPGWDTSSRVKVIIEPGKKQVDVLLHREIESISNLIGPVYGRPMTLMVGYEAYMEWLLIDLGFKRPNDKIFNEKMRKILQEALKCAIPQMIRLGKVGRKADGFTTGNGWLSQKRESRRWVNSQWNLASDYRPCPLPDLYAIGKVAGTLLKLEGPLELEVQNDMFTENSVVSSHLRFLAKECACGGSCIQGPDDSMKQGHCHCHNFFQSLSFLILDIFGFSLFDTVVGLKFQRSSSRTKHWEIIEQTRQILISGESRRIDPMELLKWARGLLGHGSCAESTTDGYSLLTSAYGQVAYVALFENLRIEREGYLKLNVLKGSLRYDDTTYTAVTTAGEQHGTMYGSVPEPILPDVLKPSNLFGEYETFWDISPEDHKIINLSLGIRKCVNPGSPQLRNPWLFLENMHRLHLLESCTHNPDNEITFRNISCRYVFPWDRWKIHRITKEIIVVATNRFEEMRCLASTFWDIRTILIRRDACLDCCLTFCKINNIDVLIM